MKAAVLGDNGLEIRDIPAPKPKANEILVRVRAAASIAPRVMMASGYRHGNQGGPGTVIGLEWSGEVVEAGAEVKDFKPGQRVMCSGNGGYAEYAVAEAGRMLDDPGQQHDLRAGGDPADRARRPCTTRS